MFCPFCGGKLDKLKTHCSYCGNKLISNNEKTKKKKQ